MAIILVYKTFTSLGSGNQQAIQELPMKWLYLIILVLVTVGAAGLFINVLLGLLGLESIDYWVRGINEFLAKLDDFTTY